MRKYTHDELENTGINDLRSILRFYGHVPGKDRKAELIQRILAAQNQDVIIRQDYKRKGRKAYDVVRKELNSITERDSVSQEEDALERLKEIDSSKDGVNATAKGVFEGCPDGYGFLRVADYDNSPRDVFVSPVLVKRYSLFDGDYIVGTSKKTDINKAAALIEITSVNGDEPILYRRRVEFDSLVPHYPTERYTLERKDAENDYSIRCIDLFSPIGKGQRGLIVAPPKAGKTTLLKKIANSISVNYPETHLITLLIDERPEEVTDIRESVGGEVVASTFDESVEHHIKIAELVLNRAKRLVEGGKDVFVLLDSITKLARAYNATAPSSGKTLSGGIDVSALQSPKKFFGSARNIVNGGSLTIVATALVETGSKMDEVIYEEFKGTGNMEIHLSRELSERRIFPAIDLYKSGTRKDELLLSSETLTCVNSIRRYLQNDRNASENMLDMMAKMPNNSQFVERVPELIKLVK